MNQGQSPWRRALQRMAACAWTHGGINRRDLNNGCSRASLVQDPASPFPIPHRDASSCSDAVLIRYRKPSKFGQELPLQGEGTRAPEGQVNEETAEEQHSEGRGGARSSMEQLQHGCQRAAVPVACA